MQTVRKTLLLIFLPPGGINRFLFSLAAVAEHLEVLCLVPTGRVGVVEAPGEITRRISAPRPSGLLRYAPQFKIVPRAGCVQLFSDLIEYPWFYSDILSENLSAGPVAGMSD